MELQNIDGLALNRGVTMQPRYIICENPLIQTIVSKTMNQDALIVDLPIRSSRYDSLLRGEFRGTDVTLIFVDENAPKSSSESEEQRNDGICCRREKRCYQREIRAHRAFLRCCGLFRAALEKEHGYAEANRNEVRVVVPPGTLGAVDGLLRWCYDGSCHFQPVQRKTNFLVLESRVEGIAALWSLSDFVQCLELCKAIASILQDGTLRSGSSFAALLEEATNFEVRGMIGAAVEGLPLEINRREELEVWLDFGGDDMLYALAKCHAYFMEESDDEESNGGRARNLIVETLGEYLAEMKRSDRAKMSPSLFASCLSHTPPGMLPEADYAEMVLNYIEDACKQLTERSVMALLSSIDFGTISSDTLGQIMIPRIERLTSSHYALGLRDIVPLSKPVIARCAYSAQLLNCDKKIAVLPCDNLLSYDATKYLYPKYRFALNLQQSGRITTDSITKIQCPACFNHTFRRNDIIQADLSPRVRHNAFDVELRREQSFAFGQVAVCHVRAEDLELTQHSKNEIERLRSYFERKRIKYNLLQTWALSFPEEEGEPIQQRPTGKTTTSRLIQEVGPFVNILNQCSAIGKESIQTFRVDSWQSELKPTLDSFAEKNHFSSSQDIQFFFRKEPVGPDATWEDLPFELDGSDVLVAKRKQEAGKPVIRFYSKRSFENILVSLHLEGWQNILAYPRPTHVCNINAEQTPVQTDTVIWSIRLLPGQSSATIEHASNDQVYRRYSYLFWEASTWNGFNICTTRASCVRSDVLVDGLLQDSLLAQGLSVEEATEMATHWLPAMSKRKFVIIQFLPQDVLDQRAKLSISPNPEVIHRVFMLFHPTDSYVPCQNSLIRSPPLIIDRGKFIVVEWGGMEC